MDYELVIVDDGSTDSSAKKALREIKTFNSHLLVVSDNRGAHEALNLGIEVASGEWITILNSDDEFLPNRISTIRQNAHNCEVLATNFRLIDSSSKAQKDSVAIEWKERSWNRFSRTRDLKASLLYENFIATTSNLSFTKETWSRLGGFADLRYCHDIDFILRAALITNPLVLEDIETVKYRQHSSNTISENFAKVQAELMAVLANFIFEENTGRHELGQFLESKPTYRESLNLRSFLEELSGTYETRTKSESREAFFHNLKSPKIIE